MTDPAMVDVLVLGAGPAGAAAAAFAACKGLRVTLIDEGVFPQTAPRIEWLHPEALPLLQEMGVKGNDLVVGRIDSVHFLDPRHTRSTKASCERSVDLVLSNVLVRQLHETLAERGMTIKTGTRISAIEAGEDAVTLISTTGERTIGSLLIAADGCDSWAARKLGVYPRGMAEKRSLCCQWSSPESNSARPGRGVPETELSLILASENLGEYGYAFRAGRVAVVGFVTTSSDAPLQERFEEIVDWCKTDGILPDKVAVRFSEAVHHGVPRGLALDMETHVAKRSLIIGDAGGFVSSISHEGLYPALWSASLAVETCLDALGARHPQDALAQFDSRWRGEMVTYLRLPNTELRFLMPLVFSNERMANRLAQAFLCGENL